MCDHLDGVAESVWSFEWSSRECDHLGAVAESVWSFESSGRECEII